MARVELSEKAVEDWENSLKPDKFLASEDVINTTKKFLKEYNMADDEKKKSLIKELAQVYMKVMNIDVKVKVPNVPTKRTRGFYNKYDEAVTIYTKKEAKDEESAKFDNLTFLSNEILTTLLHELRHAYQDKYIVKEQSDFGKVMNYYRTHYVKSDDSNFMNNIGYRTNFTEVDAQRFSFKVAKALAEEILTRSQGENRVNRKILEVKLWQIKEESQQFEDNYKKNSEYVLKIGDYLRQITDHYKKSVSAFYSSNLDETGEKQNAKLISDALFELFHSQSLISINNLTSQDFANIYIELLSSIKPEDLVSKPNNLLTSWFINTGKTFSHDISLTKKQGDNIVVYRGYVNKLLEAVEFGKIFLNKFNIEHKDDNRDIYLKYANHSFEYLADLFINDKTTEFDKMLAENIISLETRDPNNFGREKMLKLIEEKFTENEIKQILKQNIDSGLNNDIINIFQLNKGLFNGYGESYSSEKRSNLYSQFLDLNGIKFEAGNFDDIIEKFNKNYPSIVAGYIGKEKLSETDEATIYNSPIFLLNNNKLMKNIVDEIKKKYTKEQVLKLFESSEDFMIQCLKQWGLNFEKFNFKDGKTNVVESIKE